MFIRAVNLRLQRDGFYCPPEEQTVMDSGCKNTDVNTPSMQTYSPLELHNIYFNSFSEDKGIFMPRLNPKNILLAKTSS